MIVFGNLSSNAKRTLQDLLSCQQGLEVVRQTPARSSVAHPQSTDLELALKPQLTSAGFQHHVRLEHPRTGDGFEYDFWRPDEGIALEVMGYRADDEVYKNILKFHVHEGTQIGVALVPRYKWISSRRTETNYSATLKALSFANHYLDVDALVAVAYDWEPGGTKESWILVFPKE